MLKPKVHGHSAFCHEFIEGILTHLVKAWEQGIAQGQHGQPRLGNGYFTQNSRSLRHKGFVAEFAIVRLVVLVGFAFFFGMAVGLLKGQGRIEGNRRFKYRGRVNDYFFGHYFSHFWFGFYRWNVLCRGFCGGSMLQWRQFFGWFFRLFG